MSYIKYFLQSLLRQKGRCIERYPLAQYLRDFSIDCYLDVGANSGQTGKELRTLGYRGRIISFEPQSSAYSQLETSAAGDEHWNTYRHGLGDRDETLTLNISGLNASSSFRQLTQEAVQALPQLSYIETEQVVSKRLDNIIDSICQEDDCIFLKIDTQGYEMQVLEGASGCLDRIKGLQIELSIVAQYQNEILIEDMIRLVRSYGFVPYWLLPGHRNYNTMQLYQVDMIAFRP